MKKKKLSATIAASLLAASIAAGTAGAAEYHDAGGNGLTQDTLKGEFAHAQWVYGANIIAVKEGEESPSVFKWNTGRNTFELLSSNEYATNMAVSSDGKTGIFTNGNGQLYTMNLTSGRIYLINADNSVKTDLTWSPDGTKVYFVQGDKQEKIAYYSFSDKKIATVLADKVENKIDLHISADGGKLLYSVITTGVAKNDSASTEESLTIDYSGAGAQLFSLDLKDKEALPVQLTKGNANKLYANFLADGQIVYVSASAEENGESSVLKLVSADGATESDLVKDVDVVLDIVTLDGHIYIAGTDAGGNSIVYAVKPDGTKTEIFKSENEISELSVAKDGGGLVAVSEGKIVYIHEGQGTDLTN